MTCDVSPGGLPGPELPTYPPSPPSPPLLAAEGLIKIYRPEGAAPAEAVRGVDLRVDRGEFVTVIGPSGAGKSTLLHLLGGLDRPDTGRIRLDGRRVDTYSEARWAKLRRSSIGVVFQFFNLISNLTVADNIELPALLAGRTPRRARASCEELLAELGLEGKQDSTPDDLSRGEQQRVALARALINSPALLLADEPTGSLDSKAAREVLRLLSRFHQRGQTILMVTNNPTTARVSDRVICLYDGRVVDDPALGTPGCSQGKRAGSVADVLKLKG